MSLKQPWIVAMAAAALAGFGNSVACDERSVMYEQQVPIVEMADSH
jgi:hypothetical protein